jgi:hypothetical protein
MRGSCNPPTWQFFVLFIIMPREFSRDKNWSKHLEILVNCKASDLGALQMSP